MQEVVEIFASKYFGVVLVLEIMVVYMPRNEEEFGLLMLAVLYFHLVYYHFTKMAVY